MKLTKREFRRECLYAVTMLHVKKMLRRDIITGDEYWQINTKFKAKYLPVSDGLVSEKRCYVCGKERKW